MEPTLTTREAADQLGITVRQFHGLASKHDLIPARELPGIRGAKFWRVSDVVRLASKRDRVSAA